jgi:hypothetical protein
MHAPLKTLETAVQTDAPMDAPVDASVDASARNAPIGALRAFVTCWSSPITRC